MEKYIIGRERKMKMQYKDMDEILIPFYNFIENDLYITTVGYTNFSHIAEPFKDYRVRYHYSISFVINGTGTLYVGKKKYKIKKGDIFMLPKETKAKYYPEKKSPWEYFWFNFDGNKSEKYLNLIGFEKDNYVIQVSDFSDIIYQCENLIKKRFKDDNVSYYEVLSVFYNIIDSFIKKQNNSLSNNNIVESIIKYIKLHYSRPSLTIEEICKNFNISHSYLCKLFKNKSELTAKGNIIKVRLEEAQKLLLNTNLSIKQIAYSVGFADETYFMKMFKKSIGITPSSYRNKINK